MSHCCFKKGCEYEVQYLCLCLFSETYCCEFHLETHLNLHFRDHAFDSILTEFSEWTYAEILMFLAKVKLSKEKLKKIGLASYNKNCCKSIKENIREVDADLDKINCLIEKFSQVSEKGKEIVFNLSILMLNTEKAKLILPELYRNFVLFFISIQLRNKKYELLNKVNNDIETEQDFRKTCALYEDFASEPLFSQFYQEYINAYHKLTSLYNIRYESLFIYSTETESEETHILDFKNTLESIRVDPIQFHNGDLFCISRGIPFIVDRSYQILEMPAPIEICHAVFFNRNIYCFGRENDENFSWIFDLDENWWCRFATALIDHHDICSSTIFKDNIIISGNNYQYLLLYSIDTDSFSQIPYEFGWNSKSKTLLNTGERLYAIICAYKLEIYESELGNAYSWNQIAFKMNRSFKDHYFSYNKGWIYASSSGYLYSGRDYFKFDLVSKSFIDIACYREHLALKQLDNNIEAIECYGNTFQLDSDFAESYIDKGFKIDFLASELEQIEFYSMKIIEHSYNDAEDYCNKSRCLCSIGRYLESIECLTEAFKLNLELKNQSNYLMIIADAYRSARRYIEAIDYYNELIKLYPQIGWANAKKGISLHELGCILKQ